MPRAVVCREFGPPSTLSVEDVPPLVPRAGEVVIQVLTSGLDFVATLMIQGRYQRVSQPPFTPGGEVTGVVEAVGAGVTEFAPGELVCSGGGGIQGGFAEQYRCRAQSLISLPTDFDVRRFPSLYGYQTSFFALQNRAQLQPGETLLVLGAAGGVGITCVEVGKMLGANVIAAASTDDKLRACVAAGADQTLNYADLSYRGLRDAVRELAPGGVDVVFDPVGDVFTEPCVRNLAEGGRYLVVGFAAGDIPRVPANLLLLRNAQLVGSAFGEWAAAHPAESHAMNRDIVKLALEGRIRPLNSAFFELEQVPEAMAAMASRRIQGKALVVTPAFRRRFGDGSEGNTDVGGSERARL